jgi:glycosyltransferase involved in cell wall biosynthesis
MSLKNNSLDYNESYSMSRKNRNTKQKKSTKKNNNQHSALEKKNLLIIVPDSPGTIMDSNIYKDIFEKNNFEVDIYIYKSRNNIVNYSKKKYYANLFIEFIPDNIKQKFPNAINFFMPNSELFYEFDKLVDINYIFCKNKLAYDYFKHIKNKQSEYTYKCFFTKFTTLIPSEITNNITSYTKDSNVFVHMAGKSPFKNTSRLLNCWINNNCFLNIDPNIKLYITCYDSCFKRILQDFEIYLPNKKFWHLNFKKNRVNTYKNITFFAEKAPFKKYLKILTEANVSICISEKEGYAHYLNEARFLNTFIITVDAPPMNELVKDSVNGLLLKDKSEYEYKDKSQTGFNLINSYPTESELKNKLIYCIKNKNNLYKMGEKSNKMFMDDHTFLYKSMKKAIQEITSIHA